MPAVKKEEVMWPDTQVGKIIGYASGFGLILLAIALLIRNISIGNKETSRLYGSLYLFLIGTLGVTNTFFRARRLKKKSGINDHP
jgi:hypothetical protein